MQQTHGGWLMQPFDYYKPRTFQEAFKLLLHSGENVKVLAGGTDLIPHMRDGQWLPDAVVDIKSLPEMHSIDIKHIEPCCNVTATKCLFIGAAVTMNEIIRSGIISQHWNLLQQSAAAMGNEQVRNRATIGGNICTASPAADTAPALFVLNAKVLIKRPGGDRCVEIKDFFVNPKINVLKQDEIVVGLLIPSPFDGSRWHFEKLSRRKAGDLSIVSVAALAQPGNQGYTWKLALGAVAPTPIRAYEAETILNQGYDDEAIDRAAASAYRCCSPIDDVRASMEYRQLMVINITRQVINFIRKQIEEEAA
jgi:CO/xanthine dehydrogenase FAD-binding subunit